MGCIKYTAFDKAASICMRAINFLQITLAVSVCIYILYLQGEDASIKLMSAIFYCIESQVNIYMQ